MTLRPEDCRPGTLVECITCAPHYGDQLTLGALYTVERLMVASDRNDWIVIPLEPVVKLHEIGRCAFGLKHFRLVPDSRLEVFRAMLEPKVRERQRT